MQKQIIAENLNENIAFENYFVFWEYISFKNRKIT